MYCIKKNVEYCTLTFTFHIEMSVCEKDLAISNMRPTGSRKKVISVLEDFSRELCARHQMVQTAYVEL